MKKHSGESFYFKILMIIYNLLLPLCIILFLPPHFLRSRKRGGTLRDFLQRLAIYPKKKTAKEKEDRVWLHAASVGETKIALQIISAWLKKNNKQRFVLTSTTPTGKRIADENAPPNVEVFHNPIDAPICVAVALNHFRVRSLVLVEAELWPNLIYQCQKRGLKIALVNARLSDRSERRYRKAAVFTRALFSKIDLICLCEEADKKRFMSIGTSERTLRIAGNVKRDFNEDEEKESKRQSGELAKVLRAVFGKQSSREMGKTTKEKRVRLLLLASSHDGEEKILVKIFLRLREEFPDLRLMIAPRHVERVDEIISSLENLPLILVRRSDFQKDFEAKSSKLTQSPDALLIDSTGELRAWYRFAEIAVIGKSLCASGGQNPLEAAAGGAAIIFGKNMQNFRHIAADLELAAAAKRVDNENELELEIKSLLTNSHQREMMIENALHTVQKNKGSARRIAEILQNESF